MTKANNTNSNTPSELRFMRFREVIRMTGMSKSAIYDRMAMGDFPKTVSLGGRSVAFIESEITAWMNARMMARNSTQVA